MSKQDEKFDIEDAVKNMQKYWATYNKQVGWKDYNQEMFLNDALYGVGISLNRNKYSYANGFDKFKVFLYNRFDPLVKTLFMRSLKRGS